MPEFNSEEALRNLYKELCVALYGGTPTATMRQVGTEWALVFKIDCDMAREKYGSIDYAFPHYLNPDNLSDRMKALKAKVEQSVAARAAAPAAPERRQVRRRKPNSADMLKRYGKDPEAANWINANRAALDEDESFTRDAVGDMVIHHARPLSAARETGKLTVVHGTSLTKTGKLS